VSARPLFALLVAACLLAGIAGGLLRLGVGASAADWVGHAAVAHGMLMLSGFFGSVIGIERAVALKLRWAFAAPLASALAGIAMAAGWPGLGAWLAVAGAGVFVAVNIQVLLRQRAPHTWLLLVSALMWFAAALGHAFAVPAQAALALGFAFLVTTIAAERLEMTRLMRRRPTAQALLTLLVAGLAFAALLSGLAPRGGGVLYGAVLTLLALWLGVYDIARRTLFAQGLPRYMAVCLLTGYAWLAAAGVAWAGTSLGLPWRDLALHGLGLGFVFSMVMGHAPVILPAVARIKLGFGPWFYVPLALLHGSLLWRAGPGLGDGAQRALAGRWNAVALGAFALAMLLAALVWRRKHT
jgi:hypothetical protein